LAYQTLTNAGKVGILVPKLHNNAYEASLRGCIADR
jgi:hypothetical protein